jgi:hypothetical protein
MLLMDTNSVTMSFRKYLSLERHRCCGYLNEQRIFYSAQKVLHFAPEQAFYKLFRKQKNLDLPTTDLFSPLADVKADICNLPLKTINTM